MVYEYLIELSSYSCIRAHLSRFQQLVVSVSLSSYNVQKERKKNVLGLELCKKSEN